jgi:hypothetical protein
VVAPRGFAQIRNCSCRSPDATILQRFKRSIPFSGACQFLTLNRAIVTPLSRCTTHASGANRPIATVKAERRFSAVRMRSLNDPAAGRIRRRGYVPVTRLKRKERRTGLRQSDAIAQRSSPGLARGRPAPGRCRESVPRVKRRKRRNAFRYTLEPTPRDTRIKVQTDDPSPSARQFRLALNGLSRICAETDVLAAVGSCGPYYGRWRAYRASMLT